MRWAVVLAGGSGTRFWPASTRERPKQLLPLSGGDEPLLASTVRRLRRLVPETRVVVATGAHLVEETRRVVPGVPAEGFLAEPVARNTAPCIAWASAYVAERDPDAVVGVFPADHAVRDEDAFADVLERAYGTAESGRITTVGLRPTRPETGFGYIELGEPLGEHARLVARFVEKPPRDVAESFVAGGKHLWNGGMFFFRAADMIRAVRESLPALADAVPAMLAAKDPEALRAAFLAAPSISIDHGVMEKARGLAVVPGDFGWSDVGSWEASYDLADKDADANAVSDLDVVAVRSSGTLVRDLRSPARRAPRVVALVGVSDLVVVETDDALLVMRRDAAQDVKLVAEALAKRG